MKKILLTLILALSTVLGFSQYNFENPNEKSYMISLNKPQSNLYVNYEKTPNQNVYSFKYSNANQPILNGRSNLNSILDLTKGNHYLSNSKLDFVPPLVLPQHKEGGSTRIGAALTGAIFGAGFGLLGAMAADNGANTGDVNIGAWVLGGAGVGIALGLVFKLDIFALFN
jgi:hypothetical protein